MGMLISSLCFQGNQALMGAENSGSSQIGRATLVKVMFGTPLFISTLACGIFGGGYYGAMAAGTMTENYYKRNGDANKMGSLNIGISMMGGSIVGSIIGGGVVLAISSIALGIL